MLMSDNPLGLSIVSYPDERCAKTFVFLAAPYTAPDILLMEDRYAQASRAAALLMEMGYTVFSPLSHGHPICEYGMGRVGRSAEAWRDLNDAMIYGCNALAVLDLEGMWTSRGVAHEVAMAEAFDIPVNIIALSEGSVKLVEAKADPALWTDREGRYAR